MSNSNKLLDPIKIQQAAKYRNGLTVTSNDTNIIPRDAAGNIQLDNTKETNPLLIIEPVATKITLNSILKVLDTQFQYFKFPATSRIIADTDVDIDLSVDELEQDIISTELRLPVARDEKNQPAPWDRISTTYKSSWYYNTGYEDSGFKELPFTGDNQVTPNAYVLTKETIDELRRLNKTLKFTIQTQFQSDVTTSNTSIYIRLNRGNIKAWRPWLFPQPEIYTAQTPNSQYPTLYMEYIVNPNDLLEDDTFTISAVAGNETYSINSSAYWKIEPVDIPTARPLVGINNISGVYNIGGGGYPVTLNSIQDGNTLEIGSKFPGSDQFIFKQDSRYKNLKDTYSK